MDICAITGQRIEAAIGLFQLIDHEINKVTGDYRAVLRRNHFDRIFFQPTEKRRKTPEKLVKIFLPEAIMRQHYIC